MKKKILLLILCISLLAASIFAISAFAADSTKAEAHLNYTDADVPESLANYKFVLFKNKGTQLFERVGYNTLKNAVNAARGWNNTWTNVGTEADPIYENTYSEEDRTSVILMRGDYTTISTDAEYENWAQGMKSIVINLNGHTLTQGAGTEALFSRMKSKPSSSQGYIFDTKYILKNGNVVLTDKPLFKVSVWDVITRDNIEGYSITNKNFTWDIENVNFSFASGATATNLLAVYSNSSPAECEVAPFFFNFTDCTFDLTNAPSAVTLFNVNPSEAVHCKITVTVDGGNIVLPSTTTLTVAKDTGVYNSSITFGENASGNYITLDAPGGNYPTASVKAEDGVRYFVQSGSEGDAKFYLTKCELDLGNGFVIPEKYENAQVYPFVLFREDKTCYGAYKYWHGYSADGSGNGTGGVLSAAKTYVSNAWDGTSYGDNPKEAFIFMRRDYYLQKIDGNVETFNNLAQIQGTVNVDLGGHMLSAPKDIANQTLFYADSKGWSGAKGNKVFPTTINVSNGTMRHNNNGIVRTAVWDSVKDGTEQNSIAKKNFNFTFNNVTFGFVEGADSVGLIVHTHYHSTTVVAPFNFTYNDCVFDLETTESKHHNAFLFNIAATANNDNTAQNHYAKLTHVVNGGVIKTGGSKITIASATPTYGSSVTFGKGSDGKYTQLIAPSTMAAPSTSLVYNTEEEIDCVFTLSAATDGKTTYSLYPKAMLDYNIKTSVTLWTDFVYNIYLPKAGLKNFTVNGKTVSYSEVDLGGVSYYRVKVNLAACEALSDISLKATIEEGGKSFNIAWTLDLLNYTKSILGGEDYMLAEKNLMKDMLAYTKAAYNYFEKSSDKLSAVDSLIGADYSNAPDMTKTAKIPTGSGFSNVTFYLGSSPAYRFYYTGSKPSYTYSVNGRTITPSNGSDANGTYVELKVYAFEILSGISFTDGSKTHEYNIYSYYNQASADVKPLVEKLVKYCESAERYRIKDEYGAMTLNVPDEVYANYKNNISVSFTAKDPGNVTYTAVSSNSNVSAVIEDGVLIAKVSGITTNSALGSSVTVTVTATTEYHKVSSTIAVSIYEGQPSDTTADPIGVEKKLQYYEKNIIKEENKRGIIFIGDSYFDGYDAYPNGTAAFYKDFYADWAGENAFLLGMSSSEIHQLEVASERLVYPMEPSAIVMHIGHNDMHHGPLTPEQFVERLKALVNKFHTELPNTKIYYCGAEPKKSPKDTNGKKDMDNNRAYSSFVEIPAVNNSMIDFASNNSWFVYVDTPSIFTNPFTYANVSEVKDNTTGKVVLDSNTGKPLIFVDTDATVKTKMYPNSDGSHPSLIAYDLMRIKIKEAMGEPLGNVININNYNSTTDLRMSGKDVDANGNIVTPKTSTALTGDFAISGKLVVTQYKSEGNGPHIQFRFGTNDRFLIWDNDNDNVFGAGYQYNGTYTSDKAAGISLFDASNGLFLNWAVIVKDGSAYFYVNGLLQKKFDSFNFSYFNIGASLIDAVVYDIDIDVKSVDSTGYANHIKPYLTDGDTVNAMSNGFNLSSNKNGTAFTDASGNALKADYIAKGKLNISSFTKDNAYIQFRFGSGSRFLLWDSNNDGVFGAGYTETTSSGSKTVSDTTKDPVVPKYDANGGLTLDWAVVVNGGKAYWYINGVCVKIMETPNLQEFRIGVDQMDVSFYNIEVFVKADNADAYASELSKYSEVN